MIVFVNPQAGGGRAARRWKRIEPKLRAQLGPFETFVMAAAQPLPVCDMLRRGERLFVAAGGDGTVQALLQAVLTVPDGPPSDVCIGAIGLGSSNDFHKPHAKRIDGIPCAVANPHRRDVGVLTYLSDGKQITRYWLLNCSVGVTAEANAFFNAPDRLLSRLKSTSTTLAIGYAAFRTVFSQRGARVRLHRKWNEMSTVQLTNLAVLKSPHCSGSLCYEIPFEPVSGALHVHLAEALSIGRRLHMLTRLARTRTKGLAQTHEWPTGWLRVDADEPFAVEFDGEVVQTTDAVFTVSPRRVRICS